MEKGIHTRVHKRTRNNKYSIYNYARTRLSIASVQAGLLLLLLG
jgi:hypothetical protein